MLIIIILFWVERHQNEKKTIMTFSLPPNSCFTASLHSFNHPFFSKILHGEKSRDTEMLLQRYEKK